MGTIYCDNQEPKDWIRLFLGRILCNYLMPGTSFPIGDNIHQAIQSATTDLHLSLTNTFNIDGRTPLWRMKKRPVSTQHSIPWADWSLEDVVRGDSSIPAAWMSHLWEARSLTGHRYNCLCLPLHVYLVWKLWFQVLYARNFHSGDHPWIGLDVWVVFVVLGSPLEVSYKTSFINSAY